MNTKIDTKKNFPTINSPNPMMISVMLQQIVSPQYTNAINYEIRTNHLIKNSIRKHHSQR